MIFYSLRFGFSKLSKVLVSRHEDIGIVSMNSKQDVNCLSIQMNSQLATSINSFARDPSVKLVLLNSTVPGLFCAGGNIKYFSTATYDTFKNHDIFEQLYAALNNIQKPIITAINGKALGGGFQMTLITDIIVCSKSSKFSMPQLKLGISTVLGASQRLPRLSGRINTSRMVFGTQMIDSQRAYQLGIVAEILEDQGFDQKVIQFCKKITNKPLEKIIQTKRNIKNCQSNNHFK